MAQYLAEIRGLFELIEENRRRLLKNRKNHYKVKTRKYDNKKPRQATGEGKLYL